ncbi:hypothetical protein NDU88_004763 [Pleurodeles waltl]|uniref:Uncharacterized protein n=1 Tax=Pleurodeles waltl TaxID=8319 RepID=A0AAV7PGY8_PLEWA|nr:hypothetical protein NDU88_004763 [Pleurodeles waltl]
MKSKIWRIRSGRTAAKPEIRALPRAAFLPLLEGISGTCDLLLLSKGALQLLPEAGRLDLLVDNVGRRESGVAAAVAACSPPRGKRGCEERQVRPVVKGRGRSVCAADAARKGNEGPLRQLWSHVAQKAGGGPKEWQECGSAMPCEQGKREGLEQQGWGGEAKRFATRGRGLGGNGY